MLRDKEDESSDNLNSFVKILRLFNMLNAKLISKPFSSGCKLCLVMSPVNKAEKTDIRRIRLSTMGEHNV